MSDLNAIIGLLRHAPSPAWIMDAQGRILHANHSALALLGPASTGSELDPDWSSERHARVFERAQQGKESRFDRKLSIDGTPEPFVVFVPPSSVPGVMVAWLLSDRVTEGLIETERLASMGTLAAGVAHEIRNPLTHLSGNLAVLKRELRAMRARLVARGVELERIEWVDEMLTTVAEACQGSDRVATIVEELRTSSHSDESSLEPVDPLNVLDAAINMASTQFRHHAELERAFRPVPAVLANETRLAQVFVNLLINAAHATSDRDNARITVRSDLRPEGIVFEVSDNGPGIDPKDADRIFEPFYTTKPIGIGTGLGLPICRRIVRSFDGDIEVAATSSAGTTMRVTLPALLDETTFAESYTPTPLPIEPERKARVLIVDDEPLVCSTLRRGLAGAATVRVACSVQEALDALRKDNDVDAIVCDVMMPNLGGADLYQALQERWPQLASRMIFMSGGTLTARAQRVIGSSGRPVLEKPFDLHVLRGMIEDLAQAY
ncbi:MAG TPA: ATP-binding protein [Myxococcota bacterium]|nr:ATP-binding protein [Myxococcota bacterium]